MMCQLFKDLPSTANKGKEFVYSCDGEVQQLNYYVDGALVFKHLFDGKHWLTIDAEGKCSKQSLSYLSMYSYMPTDEHFAKIDQAESLVREIKRRDKKMREAQKITDYFSVLKPLTDDQARFLREDILPNYIFYSRAEDTAYCSACHSEFSPKMLGKTRQGLASVCPICGKNVILKSKGWGHNIWNGGTGVIIQPFRQGIVLRYFDISKSYSGDYRNPSIHIKEQVREIFGGNFNDFYEDDYRGWHSCTPRICRDEVKDYVVHYRASWTHNKLYPLTADDLRGTAYEHCHYEMFWDYIYPEMLRRKSPYCQSPWRFRWWFLDRLEHGNLLEYLFKVGFKSIALHYYFNPWSSPIKLRFNPLGKRLNEMLRITKAQLNQLLTMGDASPFVLNCMQAGVCVPNEYYPKLEKFLTGAGDISWYAELFKFSVGKFLKYMDIIAADKDAAVHKYFDYLNLLNKMGRDLRNDFLVFPKHFTQAHNNLVEEHNREINKEKRAKAIREGRAYAKRVKELKKIYSFDFNGLQIVVPKNCGQIIDEGIALHHCVGTYVDKVRNGKTVILFIRKAADIPTPFYTMEVRDGRMIQCYGFGDCQMTPEVKKFVNEFCTSKKLVS